jgi:O-antigen ligase
VFLTYRTSLVAIAILSAIGSHNITELKICRKFLGALLCLFALMLISVLRIPGSHFEGFYLWSRYLLFAVAFVNLANFARYQSARWRGFLFATIVTVQLGHLLPDLVRNPSVVTGFSKNNANYFATFLLIGLAATVAAAIFATVTEWRIAAGVSAAVLLFGIVRTSSRGATIAVVAMLTVTAIRARGRIPRQVWLGVGLAGLLAAILISPLLVQKFLDRGEKDPYNYARTEIWKTSLHVIAEKPVLGVGLGQFFHISKRFTLPVDGTVARYMKRAQMAHNEYLQHIAELGFPAALLLFGLLGYLIYRAAIGGNSAWPDLRCFHEAALFAGIGVGVHALVDNCWIIPVTASGLVILALADPLPLTRKESSFTRRSQQGWRALQLSFGGIAVAALYVYFIAIPGIGLYYNDEGHKAYDRDDFATAERYHLAAIGIVPNHPLFLDNLGMVYLQEFSEKRDPKLLAPAKEYFQRAIDTSPQSLDPHVHMETVLVRSLTGDPERDRALNEEIIRVDKEMLEVDPFLPFARKNLAGAYYNIGEIDQAFLELRRAIEDEPNYVPGYLTLGIWYGEHGDPVAGQRYTAAGVSIINRYRNFKPTEPYEGVLLGRPDPSWIALTAPKQ